MDIVVEKQCPLHSLLDVEEMVEFPRQTDSPVVRRDVEATIWSACQYVPINIVVEEDDHLHSLPESTAETRARGKRKVLGHQGTPRIFKAMKGEIVRWV